MLTKVTVYSSLAGSAPLVFNIIDKPENDLFEVQDITGLGPVRASVNTTPFGSVDGESYLGSSVGKRNIVFTIGLIPDWSGWTYSKLRRKLDSYFMPKSSVTLIFESDEFSPVAISGYVEANDPSIFSKSPENQVSIICPEPDFVAVDPVVISNSTPNSVDVTYNGTIPTGILVEVNRNASPDPTLVSLNIRNPGVSVAPLFRTSGIAGGVVVDSTKKLVVSSVDRAKYIQNVRLSDQVITNLLAYLSEFSVWPKLMPGLNHFDVSSNHGTQNWTLTYYERFGSL